MLQFAALFAVFLGFLSQGGRAAVQPADVVDQNKDAVDAFADTEWKVPPGLLEVNLENFETTVQGHELSVMVFFTKFSPYVVVGSYCKILSWLLIVMFWP